MKSHAPHIQSKCITRKKTFMTITSIHRENNTNHELESKLHSINSNACTWVFFIQYFLLALLFSWVDNNTMHNEGVYICFPSWTSKLSNLDLNSYLPLLSLLNADYLPKDESYPLKVHYNIQSAPS